MPLDGGLVYPARVEDDLSGVLDGLLHEPSDVSWLGTAEIDDFSHFAQKRLLRAGLELQVGEVSDVLLGMLFYLRAVSRPHDPQSAVVKRARQNEQVRRQPLDFSRKLFSDQGWVARVRNGVDDLISLYLEIRGVEERLGNVAAADRNRHPATLFVDDLAV